MIVKSKLKRQQIKAFIIAFAMDLLIAWVISTIFDLNPLAVFVAIYALQLALWIRDSLAQWLFWMTMRREQVINHVRDFLRAENFPDPGIEQDSARAYFQNVGDDESLDFKIRKSALAEGSFLAMLPHFGSFQEYIRMASAYDDAIEKYHRDCAKLSTP